ncbi:MAG: energy-coupling factor transporter transmembrane protein EcfT [Firmicutes bacterium]|nr:energy-coupling factor transporter transmembrane protein EcfT [Bacillota bacterium]
MAKMKKDRAEEEVQASGSEKALQTGGGEDKPQKSKKEKKFKQNDQPVDVGINLFKGLYFLFVFLIAFFLWTSWSSLTGGNYSIFGILCLAFAGFLCAFMSKKLVMSGYYNLYRVLAVLLFAPLALVTFYSSEMDSFLFGFIGIFSASVLLAAILPYFFEGMKIEKIAIVSLVVLFTLAYGYIFFANSVLVPREKALTFGGIYPPGMIFEKDGKNVWIFGDNRFLKSKNESLSFVVFKDVTPDQAIAKDKADRIAAQNKQNDPNKNHKNATPTPTPSASPTPTIVWTQSPSAVASASPEASPSQTPSAVPSATSAAPATPAPSPAASGAPAPSHGLAGIPEGAFVQKGENFSASPDRQGNMLAVAGERIDSGNDNEVFIVNLENHSKTVIFKDSTVKPFIPAISATYPGYTVWNSEGTKFFFFGKSQDEKISLYIADAKDNSSRRVETDGVVSACWVSPDELRIITGEKSAPKAAWLENRFCFAIKGGAIYKIKAGSTSPEKLMDINANVAKIAIHPATGNIVTFTGTEYALLAPSATSFASKAFAIVPNDEACVFSDDGKLLAYSINGKTGYLNPESGIDKVVEQSQDRATNLTITGDSRYLVYYATSPDSFFSLFNIHTLIKICDLSDGKIKYLAPNYLTGNVRSGREMIQPAPWQAFFWNPDPNSPEVFFDAIHNGKNRVKSVSIWKLSSLYKK